MNRWRWCPVLLGTVLLASQVHAQAGYSAKKGVGSANTAPFTSQRVAALNSSWYYNWNIALNPGHDPATEYVAMRHNRWWQSLDELANVGNIQYLLGFNEPERADQGNISVTAAINLWPDLEAAAVQYGLELGSPVPANANHPWLADFMTQAVANGYRVDFMTMHKYPTPNNPQAILNDAAWLHNTYGKDVWVTEFNAADWNGNNDFTHGQSYSFLIEVLYGLESTDYIKRYAIFPWDGSTEASSASAIFDPGTSELTPLGKLYANYGSEDVDGPYTDTLYYLHNRGSHQRLFDDDGVPGLADVYTEGGAVDFRLADSGDGDLFIINDLTDERLRYDGSQLAWSSGISDDSVQWRLLDGSNGWKIISHVNTSQKLRVVAGVLTMGTQHDNSSRWAFARSNTHDDDADGIASSVDNCADVHNPAQEDADGDGYGNHCDGDFDQNCLVSGTDLGLFRAGYFGTDPVLDLDSNGLVSSSDLGMFKSMFFSAPGPSAVGPCAP